MLCHVCLHIHTDSKRSADTARSDTGHIGPPSTGGRKEPASPHSLYRQGLSFGSSDTTPALHARQLPLPRKLVLLLLPLLLLVLVAEAVKPTCRQGSCDCCRAARSDFHLSNAACMAQQHGDDTLCCVWSCCQGASILFLVTGVFKHAAAAAGATTDTLAHACGSLVLISLTPAPPFSSATHLQAHSIKAPAVQPPTAEAGQGQW